MNYHYLSIGERSCMRKYYVDGLNCREIARPGRKEYEQNFVGDTKDPCGKYSKDKSIRKWDKSAYGRKEAGHWEQIRL